MPPLHLTYDWMPGRKIDPHWLFEVDFRLLTDGGHSASAFTANTRAQNTNKGLTFARSTGSTVQVGASSLKSGIGVDVACIGSRDGVNRGLVIQPSKFNRLKAGARNFAPGAGASADIPGGWYPSSPNRSTDDNVQPQPGTRTTGQAGPDGTSGATNVAVVGLGAGGVDGDMVNRVYIIGSVEVPQPIPSPCSPGGTGPTPDKGTYAPFFSLNGADASTTILSVWSNTGNKANQAFWGTNAPWYAPEPASWAGDSGKHYAWNTETHATWARIALQRGGSGGVISTACLGIGTIMAYLAPYGHDWFNSPLPGGTTGTFVYDFAQLEYGTQVSEAIDASDGLRAGDRVDYAYGNELSAAGRLRILLAFIPKHASADTVVDSSGGATPSFTLWSWDGGAHRVLCEIVQTTGSTGVATGAYKVVINSVESGPGVSSVEALSWSAFDFVEVFVEAGAGAATKIKYRRNGGAWTVLTDLAALATVTPTGTVHFGWDGLGDSRQLFAWFAEIRTYDAVGAP